MNPTNDKGPLSVKEVHAQETWCIDSDGDIGAQNCCDSGDIVCHMPAEGFDESIAHWPRRAQLIIQAPTILARLAMVEMERDAMREALQHYADLPLEEFGLETKPDDRPITGFNSWSLTVGHIRKARALLSPSSEAGKGEK